MDGHDWSRSYLGGRVTLAEMEMRGVGLNIALASYQCRMPGQASNRSSVWVRSGADWLLEFHQGTPTDA